MRRVPGGLTTRGRCLLAAGLAAALCALVLDERDLLRVAAFVVVLPVLAVLLAGRAQLRLRADRLLVPPRIPVGAPAEVRLAVSSTGRWGAGGLLLEDSVPYVLGEHPRFVVERLRGEGVVLSYPLRPALRGIHPLGPLVARTTDPFGLAEFRSELGGTDRLVVTPVVVPLRGVPRGGGAGSGDEGAGRLSSGQGEDDVVVRGYRQGDDLRRVHWRSTARRDELMVRVEERPWRGGVTLLLDTRSVAHRGAGPAASFERAVSFAASAALHLQRHGQRVRLVTEGGRVLAGGPGAEDAAGDALLDALAALAPSHQRELAGGPALAGGQEVVAVLGSVGQAAVQQLVEHRPRGRRSSAVLLDVRTWAAGDGADAAPDPQDAARLLSAAGWTVTVARRSDPMGAVWAALASSAPQPVGVS